MKNEIQNYVGKNLLRCANDLARKEN